MNYLISHLASIGLILDIIGVSILFFVAVSVSEQIIRIDQVEERKRRRTKLKKETALRIGYVLIFIGFILQLISNERKIVSTNIGDSRYLQPSSNYEKSTKFS
jgi:uncharacterized membrane protein